jgi:hypothetical protein
MLRFLLNTNIISELFKMGAIVFGVIITATERSRISWSMAVRQRHYPKEELADRGQAHDTTNLH